jgi:hypothetical protein
LASYMTIYVWPFKHVALALRMVHRAPSGLFTASSAGPHSAQGTYSLPDTNTARAREGDEEGRGGERGVGREERGTPKLRARWQAGSLLVLHEHLEANHECRRGVVLHL